MTPHRFFFTLAAFVILQWHPYLSFFTSNSYALLWSPTTTTGLTKGQQQRRFSLLPQSSSIAPTSLEAIKHHYSRVSFGWRSELPARMSVEHSDRRSGPSSRRRRGDNNNMIHCSKDDDDFDVVDESEVGGSNNKKDDEWKPKNVKVLGIMGGIGSGKSEACRILVTELGCIAHLESDSIAHEVYAPGSDALHEIANEFGPSILDENGVVDRKKLGGIVFADRKEMIKLEKIVWPHVKDLIINRIKEIDDKYNNNDIENKSSEEKKNNMTARRKIVVVEGAVMLDAKWEDIFDGLWSIRASKSTTQERLVSDRGMDVEDAILRIDAQNSRRGIGNVDEEVERGLITGVVENVGTIETLKQSLEDKLEDPTSWKDDGVVP